MSIINNIAFTPDELDLLIDQAREEVQDCLEHDECLTLPQLLARLEEGLENAAANILEDPDCDPQDYFDGCDD